MLLATVLRDETCWSSAIVNWRHQATGISVSNMAMRIDGFTKMTSSSTFWVFQLKYYGFPQCLVLGHAYSLNKIHAKWDRLPTAPAHLPLAAEIGTQEALA